MIFDRILICYDAIAMYYKYHTTYNAISRYDTIQLVCDTIQRMLPWFNMIQFVMMLPDTILACYDANVFNITLLG